MDLNGDKKTDILSGSYSGDGTPMIGFFQVLWGTDDGSFNKPTPLKGNDGKPLAIPAEKRCDVRRICTRPFAVDWDADGDLDLVSGNFEGTFFLFRGEGNGRFQPAAEMLKAGSEDLKIEGAHSDPFVIDWDGDGDLDLLSGSSNGGVQWSENSAGPKKDPTLKPFKSLINPAEPRDADEIPFEKPLPTSPSNSTRVWAADVNGDGKLDILLGDNAVIQSPAPGIDEEEFSKKMTAWKEKMESLQKSLATNSKTNDGKLDEKMIRDYYDHQKARNKFLTSNRTGFVWLYLRK